MTAPAQQNMFPANLDDLLGAPEETRRLTAVSVGYSRISTPQDVIAILEPLEDWRRKEQSGRVLQELRGATCMVLAHIGLMGELGEETNGKISTLRNSLLSRNELN
jgi:hypothetical protein